jgi:hypothetical protein
MRRPRSRSNLSRPSAPVVQPYQAVIARPVRTANCSFSFATLMTISLSEKFRYIPTTVEGEPIHTKFVLAGIVAAPTSFPMCAAIRSAVVWEPNAFSNAIGYAQHHSQSYDAVIRFALRCSWQRDRDARALIVKQVFGLPICLGAAELLCQIVLSIWNSFGALVLRNKAQFQELMRVDYPPDVPGMLAAKADVEALRT